MNNKYKIGDTVKVVECLFSKHDGLVGVIVDIYKNGLYEVGGKGGSCSSVSKVQLVPKKKRYYSITKPLEDGGEQMMAMLTRTSEPKKKEECKCHCHINTGVWGLKKAICCSPTKAIKPMDEIDYVSIMDALDGRTHDVTDAPTGRRIINKINELIKVTNLKK